MSQATDSGAVPPAEAEPKRLRRSRSDRVLAGVCGGLADYFGLHHGVYRVAFVALTFVGGAGILLYIAAALVIPDEGEEDSIVAHALHEHRERPWLVIGVALLGMAALIFLSSPHAFLWNGHDFWLAALVLGIVIVLWQVSARREESNTGPAAAPPAPPQDTGTPAVVAAEAGAETAVQPQKPARSRRRPSLFWPGIGLLLSAGGLLGLMQALDAVDVNWTAALAGAVIFVGAVMTVDGWRGRGTGLAFVAVLLLLAMGIALSASGAFRGGIGERIEQPTKLADLSRSYRFGIGNLELDLTRLKLKPGERKVEAHLGIGRLLVTVPPDVSVSVSGHTGIGDSTVFGRDRNGTGVSQKFSDPGFDAAKKRLVLDLRVGIGDLVVRR